MTNEKANDEYFIFQPSKFCCFPITITGSFQAASITNGQMAGLGLVCRFTKPDRAAVT